MKKIIILVAFIFLSNILLSQARYYKSSRQPVQNMKSEIDWGLIYSIKVEQNANAEKNKKYANDLTNWILEMKNQVKENKFLEVLDYYYKELRKLETQSYALAGSKLQSIETGIKNEIEEYNKRMEELNNPERYWNLANDFLSKNDYNNAIKNYNYVIELAPDFAGSYLNKAYCIQNLGYYSDAIPLYTKFIELAPTESYGYHYRGWCYNSLENYTKAMSDFNKLVELAPNDASSYYSRGSVKSSLKDYYGAIKDYEKAIELKPDFSMAYNNIAWAKFEQKKYSEALPYANKAIELDPTNSIALDSRAEIKLYLNNFSGCIIDADLALKINPNLANSYFLKGRANYKLGKKQQACENWSKAGELGKTEAYEYISKYCN